MKLKQIHDIIITIASVDEDDNGQAYAATQVYRGELIGTFEDVDAFLKHQLKFTKLDSMDQMTNP